MDLPSWFELNEFNRMLSLAVELSDENGRCYVGSLLSSCSLVALEGRHVNHQRILRLCDYGGLLSIKKEQVIVTEAGRQFLGHNPESYYELTDGQKRFVAGRMILAGPWRSIARNLLLNFSPDYDNLTYALSLADDPLPSRLNAIVYLLRRLGVIMEDNSVISVTPDYVVAVRDLLSDRRVRTEKELEQTLLENRRIGSQAEEAVVEYEQKRLRSLGHEFEAQSVKRISQLDVQAGYDIRSFDGDKRTLQHDRFIEVKASTGAELRFYWTANERRMAERLGEKYWIYFVRGFRESRSGQIQPVMIRNPAKRLSELALTVEPSVYLVQGQRTMPEESVQLAAGLHAIIL